MGDIRLPDSAGSRFSDYRYVEVSENGTSHRMSDKNRCVFLRYKPLIIVSAAIGVVIWSMLLWTYSLEALQVCRI